LVHFILAVAADLARLVGILTVEMVVVALAIRLEGLELLEGLIQAEAEAGVQALLGLEQGEQEEQELLLFDIQIPIL
jgi:hypothetical protein